ncbi:MAG: DUF86 domain-containing protein [Gammaproteobacteria bacterium]|nr:DUF86 domain-containing protein [Gammaproteobacteria bacterium]
MKDPQIYLTHILECIERIELYTQAGEAYFLTHIQAQDSVYRNFEIIGEASKRIPATLKAKSPHVPWKDIAGFRDVLIHQYDGVDPNEVWVIIEEELPRLKEAILFLLER